LGKEFTDHLSENGHGIKKRGLKMGIEKLHITLFWSEIGRGFGDGGSTPTPKIPRNPFQTPGNNSKNNNKIH